MTGSGSTPTPFGFVGQGGYQSDADTGLMLCGHRYYDNSTGRFVSRDPVRAGENWYTYCSGDPSDLRDSRGLLPDCSIGNNPEELALFEGDPEAVGTTNLPPDTTIYRWSSNTPQALTPRPVDTEGLSFNLKPRIPGVSVLVKVGALVSAGFNVIKDGVTHVTV